MLYGSCELFYFLYTLIWLNYLSCLLGPVFGIFFGLLRMEVKLAPVSSFSCSDSFMKLS